MTGFYCGVLFIWVPSWFTYWSLFSLTSLTGTLGGTAGGFAFLNILARFFNASLCPFPNFTKRHLWHMKCFGGGNFAVSGIRSAIVLGMYAL